MEIALTINVVKLKRPGTGIMNWLEDMHQYY
jgi:hypothetical protein